MSREPNLRFFDTQRLIGYLNSLVSSTSSSFEQGNFHIPKNVAFADGEEEIEARSCMYGTLPIRQLAKRNLAEGMPFPLWITYDDSFGRVNLFALTDVYQGETPLGARVEVMELITEAPMTVKGRELLPSGARITLVGRESDPGTFRLDRSDSVSEGGYRATKRAKTDFQRVLPTSEFLRGPYS